MTDLHYPGVLVAAAVFFVLICLAMLIWFSPIKMQGYIKHIAGKDHLVFRMTALFGLIRYRLRVPLVQMHGVSTLLLKKESEMIGVGIHTKDQEHRELGAEDVSRWVDKLKRWTHATYELASWMRQVASKVQIKKWVWHTTVGTGDAMWTALSTGMLWSAKTTLMGVISQMVRLQEAPDLQVTPSYQVPCFATEWMCIAHIRFGYAMLAALKLIKRIIKEKGGMSVWQIIRFRA